MQPNKNKQKLSFVGKMLTFEDVSKKCHVVFKIFFLYRKVIKTHKKQEKTKKQQQQQREKQK